MIEIYYMYFNGYLLHLYTVRIPTLIGQKRLNVRKSYEKYDFFQVEFLSKYKIADTNILIFYEQKCGNELILMEKKIKKNLKLTWHFILVFNFQEWKQALIYQYTIYNSKANFCPTCLKYCLYILSLW